MRPDPFTTWTDSSETIAFMKGRVALHAILRSAGIGPGDEVLLPGFTCVVVPAAVLYTGATPVFYDIDAKSMNGAIDDARRRVTLRTRVVVVQHTFGAMTDPSPWLELTGERGLVLVEDAAHAMGATYGEFVAGRIGHGAFTSLQWSKTITTGLGGLARFNDPALRAAFDEIAGEYDEPSAARQMMIGILECAHSVLYRPRWASTVQRAYRTLGRFGVVPGSSSTEELDVAIEPSGYRMRYGRHRGPRLRRALAGLEATVEHRRHVASIARSRLLERGFVLQTIHDEADSAHLRVATVVQNRDEVLTLAQQEGVELGDWFDAPLHPGSAPQAAFGYRDGTCPTAEWLTRRLINLPTHTGVSDDEIERIVGFVVDHARIE